MQCSSPRSRQSRQGVLATARHHRASGSRNHTVLTRHAERLETRGLVVSAIRSISAAQPEARVAQTGILLASASKTATCLSTGMASTAAQTVCAGRALGACRSHCGVDATTPSPSLVAPPAPTPHASTHRQNTHRRTHRQNTLV